MLSGILLWCVLAPVCISGMAFLVARRCHPFDFNDRWSTSYATVLAVGGWLIAVSVALCGRHGFSWWPSEAWQSVIVPIAIVSLVVGLCQSGCAEWRAVQWLFAGLGVSWIALVAMPSGESWLDVQGLHRPWMFLVAVAGLLNLYCLQRIAEKSAERWVVFVALAGLAGPTILASTVYGGLAEWLVAACVATGLPALLAVRWPELRLWTVVYPSSLFAVAGTASCRFFNYAELPIWLYGIVLFIPSIVAVIDLPLRQRSTLIRVTVAAVVSGCTVLLIAWKLIVGEQPEW